MNRRFLLRLSILFTLLFLCSCGSAQYVEGAPLVASQLCSDPDGGWYDLGFVIGTAAVGGSSSTRRR